MCLRWDSESHPGCGLFWLWQHRKVIGEYLGLGAVVVGVACIAIWQVGPSDLNRAERDLKEAWNRIYALEKESNDCLKRVHGHAELAEEFRTSKKKDPHDPAFLAWCDAAIDTQLQMRDASLARRDQLVRLTAHYRRLASEAECEVLRAKEARDRGTPYSVSPRVRDLLAPILSSR